MQSTAEEAVELPSSTKQRKNKPIRLAIIGIGNCASSFIQTVYADKFHIDDRGLESPTIGGYRISDIEVVLAYDVSDAKVGHFLGTAMIAEPNCTTVYCDIGPTEIRVLPGILADGLSGPLSAMVTPSEKCSGRSIDDIAQELKNHKIDVAVGYLPTGSAEDVRAYALAACSAGVAYINTCPEAVIHDVELKRKFADANIPLLGDDMKSHAGATALHTQLIEFLSSRNIAIDGTYQLNIGGNADFKNLADPTRATSKQKSKRAALVGAGMSPKIEILAGPTGYVPHLRDRKNAYIRLEGTSVLGMRVSIEAKLDVEDSPNVVSVIADAVRIAFLTRKKPELANMACAHLFKSPPLPTTQSLAQKEYLALIQKVDVNEDGTIK